MTNHIEARYANTHTESSATGLQTSRLREDGRRLIHRAVGGTDEHVVLFCGSGTTAAVNKLVGILELQSPAGRHGPAQAVPPHRRPVVFVGPYEHHSNELPWREPVADVVVIQLDADGRIDEDDLCAQLIRHADRPLRIGSFSAASNVTGILTDTDRIAALLHAHGALSFWDFATAGPYLPIRAAESAPGRGDHKDAVFLSPHKFVGGPQSPGVLVVRGDLVCNRVPTMPGGGTPAIVESIRAGLAFEVKEAVGAELIHAREERAWQAVLDRWQDNPNIVILGAMHVRRLPVVSFLVRHEDRYLHHNFVVALLNDLFGIQARGGCSCAGPYGHRLLGIGEDHSAALRDEIVVRGHEGIKPGWTRVSFPYFMSDTVRDYVVDAVDLRVASTCPRASRPCDTSPSLRPACGHTPTDPQATDRFGTRTPVSARGHAAGRTPLRARPAHGHQPGGRRTVPCGGEPVTAWFPAIAHWFVCVDRIRHRRADRSSDGANSRLSAGWAGWAWIRSAASSGGGGTRRVLHAPRPSPAVMGRRGSTLGQFPREWT
ncbi:aminotransferase class V-fold PLP-dependent enzyme [Streptomyces sp. CB01881]|uniref:aminotransferase class V-fold PLP-dependent enzyme n=1 Tax=Streptomyces sp. CB01881 TaxID=2078691 RepID=UPI001F11B996|nr:aminotransferase class V-fold PLP-dependent enzyme [Streptomyces sp. CB01881]